LCTRDLLDHVPRIQAGIHDLSQETLSAQRNVDRVGQKIDIMFKGLPVMQAGVSHLTRDTLTMSAAMARVDQKIDVILRELSKSRVEMDGLTQETLSANRSANQRVDDLSQGLDDQFNCIVSRLEDLRVGFPKNNQSSCRRRASSHQGIAPHILENISEIVRTCFRSFTLY